MSPYELWEQKCGGSKPDYENSAMRFGSQMEPTVRELYESVSGKLWPATCFVHDQWPFLKASLDGWNGNEAIEIKCPGETTHKKALKGHVPDYYTPQLNHQFLVSGVERIHYISYFLDDFVELLVERDEAAITDLLRHELVFWDYVEKRTPPPSTEVRRDDADWMVAASAYRAAKYALDDAEKPEKVARASLALLAGGEPTIGGGVKLTPFAAKGRLDANKMLKAWEDERGEPVDTEPFRGDGYTSYKITVQR